MFRHQLSTMAIVLDYKRSLTGPKDQADEEA